MIVRIIILWVVLAIALLSCDSPTDVQANRIKIINKKNGEGIFSLSLLDTNLGTIRYDTETVLRLKITNLSNKELSFENCLFEHQPDFFKIADKSKLVLSPAGSAMSEKTIEIAIRPNKFGSITDTLFFDNYSNPYFAICATVPSVYTSELDFGATTLNTVKYKTVDVYNYGNKVAVISGIEIEGDSTAFKLENFYGSLPVQVPPGGLGKQFIVKFSPLKDIEYKVKYKFIIETENEGLIDNISTLTGLGR